MKIHENLLKKRLEQSKPCLGAWLTTDSTSNTMVMAALGFHFLVVDMEHGSADVAQVETLFAVAERYGAVPLARIASDDGELARRLLDLGAHGIIVSTVESQDRFQGFIKYCLYPPAGHRGAGMSRCNVFGAEFEKYYKDFKPLIVPMIETRRGIEAAEEIAGLPEVDVLFLGPYDLSADLGQPGILDNPAFEEAIIQVKAACIKNGKTVGIHQVEPNFSCLKKRLDDGFGLVAFGTDVQAIRHSLSGISEFIGD